MKVSYRSVPELIAELAASMKAELKAELHDEMKQEVATELQNRKLPPVNLSRREAADALGVSLPTLHKLMNEGAIPFVKIGSSTKIPKTGLEAAMKAGVKKYARRAAR